MIDTILAYQGLPTASSINYLLSAQRDMPIQGHSLGAVDVTNLYKWGMASTAAAVALPFGNVAMPGQLVEIGNRDPINGGVFGVVFNWNAEVVSFDPKVGIGHSLSLDSTYGGWAW